MSGGPKGTKCILSFFFSENILKILSLSLLIIDIDGKTL